MNQKERWALRTDNKMLDFMVNFRNSLSVEPDFHGELACEFPGSENCSSFRWRPTHGRVDKRRKGRQKKQHMFFSPENYHDTNWYWKIQYLNHLTCQRYSFFLHLTESRWLATPNFGGLVRGHDKPTPMGVASHRSFPGGFIFP